MDGIYDLGGVSGFGPVDVERDEPVFHEPWEMLGYGLGGLGLDVLRVFNMDEVRHAIERIEPRQYLASSYYDRIVIGVATLFVEKGVVTLADLEARAIRFALAHYQGHLSAISRHLGIGRSTLYRKLKELGLDGEAA